MQVHSFLVCYMSGLSNLADLVFLYFTALIKLNEGTNYAVPHYIFFSIIP